MATSTYRRSPVWPRITGQLALLALMLGLHMMACVGIAIAAPTSDVRKTKHNLSKNAPSTNSVKSSTEDQICVFCHTPHGATAGVNPLWNRTVSTSGYTRYTSASLDASSITDGFNAQPGGSSVLCLSCHDGQVALGNVNVLNAKTNAQISVNGSTTFKMPAGSGTGTGFTRNLGTDLSNDHPISITYNDALASQDGELQRLTTTDPKQRDTNSNYNGTLIGVRTSGYKPKLPLQPTGPSNVGQVQCATCHDPHLYDSADANRKFLRLSRLQIGAHNGTFSETTDIICLACHTKMGSEWANSAHANSTVADEAYTDTAANLRQFPTGTKVWQAACLNCHDTHTVSGARRLLREGTDDTNIPKNGGKSAIEETCYQCHRSTGDTARVLATTGGPTGTVPDIKTEFGRNVRMPIINNDQGGGGNTTEKHDISSADFVETQTLLGQATTTNRHVECTDCHNPHRVIRNEVFNGTGSNTSRTHIVSGTAGNSGSDGNVASGVLRGIWGVLPSYDLPNDWPEADVTMTVKKGVPGSSSTDRGSAWLTREYQLCFKCHSDYANSTTAANFPALRGTTYGGTVNTANSANNNYMSRYTNVAGEFAVNATDPIGSNRDQGEYGETNNGIGDEDGTAIEPAGTYPADTLGPGMPSGSDVAGTQNHRSWHPATFPTGRTRDERRMIAAATGIGNFRVPFNDYVGTQTMHCSDCHGNSGGVNATTSTSSGNSWQVDVGPVTSMVQGPHGSTVTSNIGNFLLKGQWGTGVTISSGGTGGLCFNCHYPRTESASTGNGTARQSGFNNPGGDSEGGHGNAHDGKPCMRCHIAVPHGWKNKAFLVNLNCVGPEAGKTSCDQSSGYAGVTDTSGRFTSGPYYVESFLRVRIWQASGNWTQSSCGSDNAKNPSGKSWMTDGNYC